MGSISNPASDQPVYLIFYSSIDPQKNKMWCPDCVDVEKPIKEAFEAPGAPKGIIQWVGQREEWRSPENEARTVWNVHNVPTVLRLVEVSLLNPKGMFKSLGS